MSNIKTTMGILSRVAPRTAAYLSALLFTLPPRVPRPARERLVLERATAHTVDSLGVPLRAWEWGAGPLVVLAHGWAGRGSQLGAFVRPLVDAGYRVVAFDQPAHGDSDGRTASLHAFAEGIRTVSEAFGGAHAVIAHSFGAMATVIALRRGLQVNRLVFVGPAAWTDRTVANWGTRYGVTPDVIRRVRLASEARYGIRWDDLLGRNLGRGLGHPLLILHDVDDDDVPFEAVTALHEAWSGAALVRTEGYGHTRILRAAPVVDRAVAFVLSGRVLDVERAPRDPWVSFLGESVAGRVA
jgi:pimeloyl-ACP methyl ester carboxylesterase